jgi:Vacuole effluxer Atg22 like
MPQFQRNVQVPVCLLCVRIRYHQPVHHHGSVWHSQNRSFAKPFFDSYFGLPFPTGWWCIRLPSDENALKWTRRLMIIFQAIVYLLCPVYGLIWFKTTEEFMIVYCIMFFMIGGFASSTRSGFSHLIPEAKGNYF